MNKKMFLAVSAAAMVIGIAASLGTSLAAEPPVVATGDPYFKIGQETLAARRAVKPDTHRAKNVIMFLGDGMDPTTVAAARIYDGQTRGQPGEENYLSFERFPYVAMSKTYNTNAQVPDSAGTMSSMMTGVKTKIGVLSVTDAVKHGDCASAVPAETIGELAKQAGLALGVVTTTRITHATPAAVYAHSANRDWEADSDLPDEAKSEGCHDIAQQLIDFAGGKGPDVVLGGGRQKFLPSDVADPEYTDKKGQRHDGRNLTGEWTAKGAGYRYVWNKADFDAVDANANPHLLGLFETSHMNFEADRAKDKAGEPSLEEMTVKAIDILSHDKNGYFLMVEGGRIDHAHHAGNAARALSETQEFAKAVAAARARTNEKDTLIIVTADHGHTLTFAGYPKRGSNILGLSTAVDGGEGENAQGGLALAGDKKPYTTLSYANGPGSVFANPTKDGKRPLVSEEEAEDLDYRQQSNVPLGAETHGGQDVTIYADGPHAYLFGGVVEQNYVFHVIDDALALRQRAAKAK